MLKIIPEGDIFGIEGVSSYAHGCNCAGAMGKGIALQFREKFPEMYKEYKALCKSDSYKPGDVFDYDYGKGHIYNLATQVSWRTKAKIEYIRESVSRMFELATVDGVREIAMPTIGAGLGGLVWSDVKEVIAEISSGYPLIDLYIVEKYQPVIK